MADIQQQIQAQRSQISQQQSQLAQARQQQLPSQQELRGTSGALRKMGALMKKIAFGKRVSPYEKAIKQVSGQAQSFEQEVAQKAPEYGSQALVQKEYQKAKSKLEPKINQLKSAIRMAEEKAQEYAGTEREESYRTRIEALSKEANVLESYLSDPIKAIKGTITGQAFKEATISGSNIYSQSKRAEQIKKAGFKSTSEYYSALPTLQKLQSGIATQEDIESLPSQIQEKITYKDIPAEQVNGITSQSKVPSIGGYYVDPKTGFGFSSREDLTKGGYVKVGNIGDDFSVIQKRTSEVAAQIKINPFQKIEQQNIFKPREFQFKDYSTEDFSYQPTSDMYVRTATGVPDVSRSTLYMQPPTPEQRLELDRLSSTRFIPTISKVGLGGFSYKFVSPQEVFGVERYSESPALSYITGKGYEDLKQKKQIEENIENINKEISDYKKKLIREGKVDKKSNEFIGDITKEEIDYYNKLYSQYEQETQRLGDREYYVGLGGFGKKVDISQVETGLLSLGQLGKVSSQSFGGGVGGKVYDVIGNIPVGRKREIDAVYDITGGVVREPTKDELSRPVFSDLVSRERFVKGGETIGTLGYYATPYLGATTFGLEVGKDFKEANYNPLTFAIKNPLEAGILLTGGALVGTRFLKGSKIIEVPGGFKQTSRFDEFFGKRIRLSEPRAGLKYEILPSTRGRYFEQLKIDKPLSNLKTDPLGLDLGKKVKFTEQQLEQFGKAGQRTRIREIKEGFFGRIKEKELFSGVTYKQPGKYQDQLQYLKDLGYTEKQAREFLRYKQPKVSKQLLEGEVNIKDSFGVGKFTTRLEKPVIDIDKSLGIKTRGGKTDIKTFSDIRIPTKGGALTIGAGAEAKVVRNILNLRGADFEVGVLGAKTLRSGRAGEYVFKDVLGVSGKTKVPFDNRGFIETGRTLLVKKVPKEDKIFIFKGGGKKSSQEYLQSLYAQELKVAPKIKEIPKTKPTQESKLELPEVTEKTPLPIIRESKYAGTGLYERTEDVSILDIPTKTTSIISPVMIEDLSIKTDVRLDTGLKFKQPLKSNVGEKLDVKPKLDIGIKPLEKIKIGEAQKLKTYQKTIQATKPIQVLRTGLRTPRPKETIKRPIPKRPFKIKFKLPESKKIKRRITKRKKRDEEFLAITKRKGKEVVIGAGKDLGKVIGMGKKRVKETLGATLKVRTKRGKQIQLAPTLGFRKSKTDPLSIVQKRETRLGTFGERKEIQRARKGGPLSVI